MSDTKTADYRTAETEDEGPLFRVVTPELGSSGYLWMAHPDEALCETVAATVQAYYGGEDACPVIVEPPGEGGSYVLARSVTFWRGEAEITCPAGTPVTVLGWFPNSVRVRFEDGSDTMAERADLRKEGDGS